MRIINLAQTDSTGYFELSSPFETDMKLYISFIGYQTWEFDLEKLDL